MMNESKKRRLQLKKRHLARRKMIFAFVTVLFLSGVLYGSIKVIAQAGNKQELYKYYTDIRVDRGDTLWGIANEYMTEEYASIDSYIKELRSINSIYDDDIYYGQKLVVPYYSNEYK